jgi:hypothetical protein
MEKGRHPTINFRRQISGTQINVEPDPWKERQEQGMLVMGNNEI